MSGFVTVTVGRREVPAYVRSTTQDGYRDTYLLENGAAHFNIPPGVPMKPAAIPKDMLQTLYHKNKIQLEALFKDLCIDNALEE